MSPWVINSHNGLGALRGLAAVLSSIGVLVILALLGTWLWRQLNLANSRGHLQPLVVRPHTVREILLERYARGELSREEFQRIVDILSQELERSER
jgi:uncharacterized membrane protein